MSLCGLLRTPPLIRRPEQWGPPWHAGAHTCWAATGTIPGSRLGSETQRKEDRKLTLAQVASHCSCSLLSLPAVGHFQECSDAVARAFVRVLGRSSGRGGTLCETLSFLIQSM